MTIKSEAGTRSGKNADGKNVNKEDTGMKAGSKRVLSGVRFMQGNYAVVEGALAAGCDFFAGYPITQANEISEGM